MEPLSLENSTKTSRKKDPFVRALYNRTQKKWREKNRERLLEARRNRRKNDPEYRERLNQKAREYRASHKEQTAASYRAWLSRNHERRLEYLREYSKSEKGREKARRATAKKLERLHSDKEYREHRLKMQRLAREKRMSRPEYFNAMIQKVYVPRWEQVVAEGEKSVQRYVRKVKATIRDRFVRWYCQYRLIDRTHPHSVFMAPAGEETDAQEE